MKPYRQTTEYTCVASSYLMVLHHFFPEAFPFDSENEMYLHDKIKFWTGGDGEYGSYPKLARHALNLGIEVKFQIPRINPPEFMSKTKWGKYMDNFWPVADEIKDNPHYQLKKLDFEVNDLLREVEEGRIPIIEIVYPLDEYTHHVVIYGEKNGKILVADPIAGLVEYSHKDLRDAYEISYMKNFISLKKRSGLEFIAKGTSASKGEVVGVCRVVDGFVDDFEEDILVAARTDPDMTPNMIASKGVVTDQGGILCHAAIVSRELEIPCIVGAKVTTQRLKSGDRIYLDADLGRVYRWV